MGRPSKIHNLVDYTDPESEEKREQRPITEAICAFVAFGVTPANAAGMHGITRETLLNWRAKGEEYEAIEDEAAGEYDPDAEIDSANHAHAPFVEFFRRLTRAEASGLAWHEANVRRAAASGKEQGGRLSLEFLARRQRADYSRNMRLDHGGKVNVEVEGELDEAIEGLMSQLSGAAAGDASDPREG